MFDLYALASYIENETGYSCDVADSLFQDGRTVRDNVTKVEVFYARAATTASESDIILSTATALDNQVMMFATVVVSTPLQDCHLVMREIYKVMQSCSPDIATTLYEDENRMFTFVMSDFMQDNGRLIWKSVWGYSFDNLLH